jgi:CO dehydrogenase/acetyl-CoA synthase alpha subunit
MKKLLNIFGIIILAGLFSLNAAAYAQDASKQSKEPVDKIVVKLQQKVLLTDDQAAKVKVIIASYIDSEKSPENLVEAQRKIESLLDQKQKAKYDIIKADWWKSLNKGTK